MGRQVKRVPLDFSWPIDTIWTGYLMPESLHETECATCKGSGYSAAAKRLHDVWCGKVPFDPTENGSVPYTASTPEVRAFAERNVRYAPKFYGDSEASIVREAQRLADLFNGQWSHHLSQEDVDALVASERLYDFTHTWDPESRWQPKNPAPKVTAAEVNRWSIGGLGHDSINCHVVIEALCKRNEVHMICRDCGGHGSIEAYPGQRGEAEEWTSTEPPSGEGWQLWETVSEGSPITPVYDTPEGLAKHIASPAYGWGHGKPISYDQAFALVTAGWAPSVVVSNGTLYAAEESAEVIA